MSGQKTEQPTAKRLRDLRRKGQVVVGKDASAFAGLIGFFAGIMLVGAHSWPAVMALATDLFEPARTGMSEFFPLFKRATGLILTMMLEIVLIAGLTSGAFTLLQTRFSIAFIRLAPSTTRLDMAKNVQQLFSLQAVISMVKQLIVLAALAWAVLRSEHWLLTQLGAWLYCGASCLPLIFAEAASSILFTGLAVIGLGAFFDYLVRRHQFMKSNRMSKNEIKDEFKQMEGNPENRSAQRRMRQELTGPSEISSAARATMLITNPTHYAIALTYDQESEKLPILTAKSKGYIAQRMIGAAHIAGVPVFERPPLARGLYRDCEIDEEIPSQYLEDVAEVVRLVIHGMLSESEGGDTP